MAANDFTPTGDSPRESDDSEGIKGALAAALAEHEAANAEGEGAAATPPAGKSEPETDEGAAGDTKQAPAEGEKAAVEVKEPAKAETDEEKAAKESAKSTEPPATWNAKDKELFAKQTPEAKAFLLDRHKSMEADYTRKTQEIAATRKEYEAVDQLFAPHTERMKQANVTKAALIQGWMGMEQTLQSGNLQAQANLIAGAAKNYRIDPVELATQILTISGAADPKAMVEKIAADAATAHAAQPQPIQLPPEVQKKLERFDTIASHVETQERQRVESETARINAELEAFKAATDAAGALLHPHFEELLPDMARLVDQATAAKQPVPPIDQLYQDAIFANPAVRQKWLDAKLAAERSTTEAAQQAARDKAAAEARAKSEKARKAGSSVTGSTGPGQPLNGRRGNDSLRSTIASALEDTESVVH